MESEVKVGVNQSEEKALKWLMEHRGLKSSEVQFNSTHPNPAFVTKDGHKFAVKKTYGKMGKTVVFYPYELEMMVKDSANTTLLLFNDDDIYPVKEIPGRILKENALGGSAQSLNGLNFKFVDRGIEGRQGEIVMRLAQRNSTSRYRRISHVPMESLLAWPDGNYEIVKSAMDGRLDFFLVLRPT